MKPWVFPNVPYSEIWWTVCKSSKIFDYFWNGIQDVVFFNLFYNRAGYKCKSWDKNIWEMLGTAEHIIVYGAGKVSREIVQELKYHKIHIDNVMTTKKEVETFEGIPVISVDEKCFEPSMTVFVVATGDAYTAEIVSILQHCGYYKIITLIEEKL